MIYFTGVATALPEFPGAVLPPDCEEFDSAGFDFESLGWPIACRSLPTPTIVLLQANKIELENTKAILKKVFFIIATIVKGYAILRISTKCPSIAAAAAIAGLTKWVRPPAP